MKNLGIISNIIVIVLIILLIIVFFIIVIINSIQKRNYLKAKALVNQTKKDLRKNYNIIDCQVIDAFDEKIPVIVIRSRKNITEIKIPDNKEQILHIEQVIETLDSSNGTLSHDELKEIEEKLN